MLSGISERRRGLITMEEEMAPPASRAEIDRAQQDFLEYIQLLEQKGELVILRESDEFV
jgi:flagellar motor switch protein FliG